MIPEKAEKVLLKVQKPGRYVGGELNSVMKDKEKVDLRYAFCFPDTYEIGMSHLGMKILYSVVNERDDAWCERVFAPWSDEFLRSYVLSAIKETENGDVELSCNRKVEGTLFETTPHYIYNDLKKITPPPAMLLWGERSYVISRLSVKLFKKRWPKAKCVSVPAGCHFFPMSHTDYVLYHWESFIKNLAK